MLLLVRSSLMARRECARNLKPSGKAIRLSWRRLWGYGHSEGIGFEKWVEEQVQKAMEDCEIHLQKVAALKP